MVDRQQLEALLANRFPGASPVQVAAAANAIMAMISAAGKPAPHQRAPGKPLRHAAASGLPSRRP
jgi:hypothetical protein